MSHLISIINIFKNKSVGNYLLVITNEFCLQGLMSSLIQYFQMTKQLTPIIFQQILIKKYLFLKKTNIEELMCLSKCSS